MLLVLLAFFGFVSLGLPDAANGVAWPLVRERFGLPQAAIDFLFIGILLGHVISAIGAVTAVRKLGLGLLLALSTAAVALALAVFAVAPAWWLFVAVSPIVGLGSGAIDSSINAYAAERLSPRMMNWLHACYGAGAAAGPLVMTWGVLRGSYGSGYGVLAGVMAVMALAFGLTAKRWPRSPASEQQRHTLGALKDPLVRLQVIYFVLYTGLEAAASQWTFVMLTEGSGVDRATGGVVASGYWWALMGGRIVLGAAVERVGSGRMVRGCVLSAVAACALIASPVGAAAIAGLLLLGFALGPIYPTLTSGTPTRFGSALAPHVVGLQVAASLVGVSSIPSLTGLIAQYAGPRAIAPALLVFAVAGAAVHTLLERRAAAARA